MLLAGMGISSVFAFFVWLFYPKNSQVNDKDHRESSSSQKNDASDRDDNSERTSSSNEKVSY